MGKRYTGQCPVCGWIGSVSSDGGKAFCPDCRQRGIITDMRAGERKRPRRKVRVGRESVVREDETDNA